MLRLMIPLIALSTSTFAAFPVLMNEPVSSASADNFAIDTSREGRALVALDYYGESAFHRLDGNESTSTSPSRFSRLPFRKTIFATPSGSEWVLHYPYMGFPFPSPFRQVGFLNFDGNGILVSSSTVSISREAQVIKNDAGFFGITSNSIAEIARGTLRGYGICADANGVAIAACAPNFSYVGSDRTFWVPRYVGASPGGQVQLVQFDMDGHQLQMMNLMALSTRPDVRLEQTSDLLRVAIRTEQESFLFNVSIATAQIQSSGWTHGSATGIWALGNGDWLLRQDGSFEHYTLAAYSSPALITPNHTFSGGQFAVAFPELESNIEGDILIRPQTPEHSSRYEWRNRHGAVLLSRDDLSAAKLDPSGTLLTLRKDSSSGRTKVLAERFDRKGLQLGEPEGFNDTALRPQSVNLLRAPRDQVVSVSDYVGEVNAVMNRITIDGRKQRINQFSPSGYGWPELLHSAGSPWVSRYVSTESAPTESVNILTGARIFTQINGYKVAIDDAIYEFSDGFAGLDLRIFRSGQSGTVTLPTTASTLVIAKAVKPEIAEGDELRFVAVAQNDSNLRIAYGVANGQATERFRFTVQDGTNPYVAFLIDGALVVQTEFQHLKRFNNNATAGIAVPFCGLPIYDDGLGGFWSQSDSTACYTGRDGTLQRAIAPISPKFEYLMSDDGDWIQINDREQTRFRVIDGIVRFHTRSLPTLRSYDRPLLIGTELYYVTERSSLSANGAQTVDTLINRTELVPISEVADRLTSSGFE
jgi:hypothetical protein